MKKLERKIPFRLRAHHARPLRRRHLVGLSVFAVLTVSSGLLARDYMYQQMDRQLGASLTLHEQVDGSAGLPSSMFIRSTLGFGIRFDTATASATATIDQDLERTHYYYGQSLLTPRAYTGITLLPVSGVGSSMVVVASLEKKTNTDQQRTRAEILNGLVASKVKGGSYAKVSESRQVIGGVDFIHYMFRFVPTSSSAGLVFAPAVADVFVGFLNDGVPVAVKINSPSEDSSQRAAYIKIVESFTTGVAGVSVEGNEALDFTSKLGSSGINNALTRSLGLSPEPAGAESAKGIDHARIVATNVPAVVKVYHVVCGQITYKGSALSTDDCTGNTGSGFFVSSDGYIATNGHVIASSARDMVLQNISVPLLTKMLQIDGRNDEEISAMLASVTQAEDGKSVATDAIARLPEGTIAYTNKKDIYVVALSSDAPNIEKIIQEKAFEDSDTIRLAELKAVDYDSSDLYSDSGFSHSDVALLKISGENFPVTHLGSLDAVAQGADLTVIGYPGEAEQNVLINGDTLQATATRGIVSAIRDVNGSNTRVVQSDVNIGHGNSGGPAFDQTGKVFGIATYLLGSSGQGDAAITYLRDIRDVLNLAKAHKITFVNNSSTQNLWEQGLDDFDGAYYHAAISKFEQVRRMYPAHTMSAEYIMLAQSKIAAGEEADSPWVVALVLAGVVLSVSGLLTFIVLMIRHRAHHNMYRAIQLGYVRGAFASMQAIAHQNRHGYARAKQRPN